MNRNIATMVRAGVLGLGLTVAAGGTATAQSPGSQGQAGGVSPRGGVAAGTGATRSGIPPAATGASRSPVLTTGPQRPSNPLQVGGAGAGRQFPGPAAGPPRPAFGGGVARRR